MNEKRLLYYISVSLHILYNKTRFRLVHLNKKKYSAFQVKNGL